MIHWLMGRKAATVLVVVFLAFGTSGCWNWNPDPCSESEESEEACTRAATFVLLLRMLHRPGSGGPAGSDAAPACSATAGGAEDLGNLQVSLVPAGQSCYYKYEILYEAGATGPFKPSFSLAPESGNVDLYVGYDNDSTGGTPGFTFCDSTTSAGGWVGCSRLAGNSLDAVTTNRSGIPAMSPGDYRIIGVYNPGSAAVEFALTATKIGHE